MLKNTVNYRIQIPKIEFNPPIYICKKTHDKFKLDGRIDKDFWKSAPYTDYFVDIEGNNKPQPRFKTRVKMLWDDENLYFAACLEGNEIWGTIDKRDDIIYYDNDFEIFIDPDSDSHLYYEFEINAKNTVWDLFLTKPYRDNGIPLNCWDIHGLQTAVYIDGDLNNPQADNKKWSVEIVMPFEALKEAAKNKSVPKIGDYWRLNFSRVHWQVDIKDNKYIKRINPETGKHFPENNWVWSPTGLVNIHYPELWGFVFFSDNTDNADYKIPEIEKLKWELRKLYYLEHKFYDEHGYFSDSLNDLEVENDLNIEVIIETTKNTFEISCNLPDKNQELSIFSDGRIITNDRRV